LKIFNIREGIVLLSFDGMWTTLTDRISNTELTHTMERPPPPFSFAGEVAIVTGAGSRLDGKLKIVEKRYNTRLTLALQVR